MQLYYTPNSPYARIARIALREYGLLGQTTELIAANRMPDNPVLQYSPVGRVPTLVRDGLAITESRHVFRYLAETAGKSDTSEDWRSIALEGQILGFLDGVSAWVREKRREAAQQSPFLLQVENDRARRCLTALEIAAAQAALRDIPCFRETALACALSLMELHMLVHDWRDGHQALAAWYDAQAARPSMRQTAPTL